MIVQMRSYYFFSVSGRSPFPAHTAALPSRWEGGRRSQSPGIRRPFAASRFARAYAHTSQITSAPETAAISVNGMPMRRKSLVATL